MMAILVGCNYKTSTALVGGERREIQPGQWLTSRDTIKKHAGKEITDSHVRTALKTLEACSFLSREITNDKKTIITVTNWNIYQCGDTPSPSNDRALTDESPTNRQPIADESPYPIKKEVKEGLIIKEKSLYTRAFETWNENAPPLTKHMKLAGSFKNNVERAINGKLEEGFTEDDILKAIQNYADVISDQTKYYFSHKWPLDAFLRQRNALPNFVDAATPLTNYLRDKTSPPNASAPTSPPKYVPETDVPQWVIDQYSHDPCKLYYIRDQWNFMGRRWDDINVKVYVTEEMREWWRKSKHNPENQGISE